MQPSEIDLINVVGMVRFSTEMALTAAPTSSKGCILPFKVMAKIRAPRGGTQQNTGLSPSLNNHWTGNSIVLFVGSAPTGHRAAFTKVCMQSAQQHLRREINNKQATKKISSPELVSQLLQGLGTL